MTITGKVKAVFDTQEFSSGFTKREFVVTTEEQYPQDIKVELVKDKCSLADKLKVGQPVTVHINIRGNEHQGKYYVSLQAWKLEAGQSQAAPQSVAAPVAEDSDPDGLPF